MRMKEYFTGFDQIWSFQFRVFHCNIFRFSTVQGMMETQPLSHPPTEQPLCRRLSRTLAWTSLVWASRSLSEPGNSPWEPEQSPTASPLLGGSTSAKNVNTSWRRSKHQLPHEKVSAVSEAQAVHWWRRGWMDGWMLWGQVQRLLLCP